MSTRRHFLQTGPAILAAAGSAGAGQSVSPNDRIRIATIGFGGMGMGDTRYALSVPGVELAGTMTALAADGLAVREQGRLITIERVLDRFDIIAVAK